MVAIPAQMQSRRSVAHAEPKPRGCPALTAHWVKENGKLTCKWLVSIR